MAKTATKKKRKAIRCKKNRVAIKVNRRTVGCRSLRAALPAPREGDERLALATSILGDDLRGVRDRRGRRAPSVEKLLRKAGPRVRRTVRAAIPQGIARLDRLGATAARASATAALARDLSNCGGPPSPARSDTYSSRSGGQKMTATVTVGAVGTFDLALESGAYKIDVSITSDECSHFDAPACPTAAGVVDATDRSTFKVSLSVARGATVLMSRSFAYSGRTTMRAEVDQDARLDFIDIDDTQTANIELGGSKQQFGPVQLLYTGVHRARVDMPGGRYAPGLSAVDIALTAKGVTVGKSDLGQVAVNAAKDLDANFATLVKKEIANFHGRETGWREPNKCVDLRFSPPPRSLKLSRGAHGVVSAEAVAREGGGASSGRWTHSGAENAGFTPEKAEGTNPQFTYDVTKAGRDVLVKLMVRVTSRAGVGQAEWTQETEDEPVYRGTLSIAADIDFGSCGTRVKYSYSSRLASIEGSDQPFAILEEEPTTGALFGGAEGYDETVDGTYHQPPCHPDPGCTSAVKPLAAIGSMTVLFEAGGDTVAVGIDGALGTDCDTFVPAVLFGSFPRSAIGDSAIVVALTFNDEISGTMTLHRVD